MKWIKDILEIIVTVILICFAIIVAFILFAITYYWFYLVFEPWTDEVFARWIVEPIKIIFSHPENVCFALYITVMLAGSICMLYVTIRDKKENRRTYCNRRRCVYLFGMNKDTFFCENCCHRKKSKENFSGGNEMAENRLAELKDAICELVNLAEDVASRDVFEMLDNAGAETIDCLDELGGYRAIGTAEDIREIYSLCKILQNVVKDYSAMGTVEEIKTKLEELDRWHTNKINENIKNPFAYTSTLICHNCDHKDEYIEELEAELGK